MAYRLKRKRFTCDDCVREWNQLVGADINSVKCKPIVLTIDRRQLFKRCALLKPWCTDPDLL